uniref:Uncharacterized protein n=1 Tax=Arundo donax TaxID=35708 RepID=A0A0A9HBN5_ARUDO
MQAIIFVRLFRLLLGRQGPLLLSLLLWTALGI